MSNFVVVAWLAMSFSLESLKSRFHLNLVQILTEFAENQQKKKQMNVHFHK